MVTSVLQLVRASQQSVEISDASQTGLDLSGDFTLELAIKASSDITVNGEDRHLIHKWSNGGGESYRLTFTRDAGVNYIEAAIANTSGFNQDRVRWIHPVAVNTWEHIALTCDISEPTATTFELFINGESQGNGDSFEVSDDISFIENSTSNFVIGARNNGTGDSWDGLVSQVRVWDDVRTLQEIQDHIVTDPTPGSEPNLQGYWKLDGDLLDETTNNNDLSDTNSPVFVEGFPFDDDGFGDGDFIEVGGGGFAGASFPDVDGDYIEVGGGGLGPSLPPPADGDFIEVGGGGQSPAVEPPAEGDFIEVGGGGFGVGERNEDGDYMEIGPPPPFVPAEIVAVQAVEILSKTTLLLTFNRDMRNDEELSNPDNYVLTLISGSLESTITSVLTGNSEFTNQVILNITPPNLKSLFSLDVTGNIQSEEGGIIDPLREPVQFETRSTKMDSVLSHLTQVYTTIPGSNIRTLLHAITREDDKIGGNREDFLP